LARDGALVDAIRAAGQAVDELAREHAQSQASSRRQQAHLEWVDSAQRVRERDGQANAQQHADTALKSAAQRCAWRARARNAAHDAATDPVACRAATLQHAMRRRHTLASLDLAEEAERRALREQAQRDRREATALGIDVYCIEVERAAPCSMAGQRPLQHGSRRRGSEHA
tara:strand:- start:295 stop:807 length:513 start_codon:yes stop_codon:yes gene_type:complete